MGQNSDKATKVIELAIWLLQSAAAHGWYDALRGCSIKREMLAENRSCESIIVRSQWSDNANVCYVVSHNSFLNLFVELEPSGNSMRRQLFTLFAVCFFVYLYQRKNIQPNAKANKQTQI